jgi:AraC family transcriptional regulator, regulatory protein of adaptative response / methylated-DNA-[protein]-cysteine methyltransferase
LSSMTKQIDVLNWRSNPIDSSAGPNLDQLWEAILSRDSRFYSSFVYGVNTTKIFCRPTCPSKKPPRERIEFFASPQKAEDAGYRPCMRCKPETDEEVPLSVQAVQKACSYLEENYASRISLAKLAEIAGQSPFHFHRTFRKLTGVTPKQYLEEARVKHAKLALKLGKSTRSSTYEAGHNSTSWLYSNSSLAKFGMSPASYKAGGEGISIQYLISECSLGKVLVASTRSGICFLCLSDSAERLLSYLKGEFPKAEISAADDQTRLRDWVNAILEYLDGKARLGQADGLPVDVAATAFQLRVWRELQNIPYGTTCSYNDIAKRIGKPKAYRAVANACGSNRVSLVIPCHRVIRKNGDLGGYRWGIERKKKLLAMEAKKASSKV